MIIKTLITEKSDCLAWLKNLECKNVGHIDR